MARRILILESDHIFAERLVEGLMNIDEFEITTATSLAEAGDTLSQDRQDLAFLPVEQDARAVHALRGLQPDLPLILTKPTTQYKVPEAYSGQVQGVLIKPLLEIDLATVLSHALAQPVLVTANRRSTRLAEPGPGSELDRAVLISVLQQSGLGKLVQTAVFARRQHLLGFWGELSDTEAATVALRAFRNWEEAGTAVQLQFVPLPPRRDELLLYTCTVADDYLLTLVALPETPLREVRLRAEKLAERMLEVLHGRVSVEADALEIETGLLGRRKTYAIVWRPLRPLPESLYIPLRRVLERLAVANACVVTHASVQAELIHLVVLCPPGKDSAWAAYLFKNGSEATIQQEYGVSARLWETGYYATETMEPLSEAELSIFLSTQS